jgi:hypothetical protein
MPNPVIYDENTNLTEVAKRLAYLWNTRKVEPKEAKEPEQLTKAIDAIHRQQRQTRP